MIREALICAAAVVASLAVIDREGGEVSFGDTFDRGIGKVWAVRQEIDGRLDVVAAPGRAGRVLRARTEARVGRVPKAALIARTAPMRAGTTLRVAFDLYVPADTPLNSLQLVDLECATCGEGGNPGIRLYLRRGRLRIDRSKIGIDRAWLEDAAPTLAASRWHRVTWVTRLGHADGGVQVLLDGRTVLSARGDTLLPGADHADRVQIGITANSNAVPATILIDNIGVSARY